MRSGVHIQAATVVSGRRIGGPRLATSGVSMEEPMNGKPVGIALASLVGVAALAPPSLAQNEQFIPQLVYRAGAYAPNGIPVANGIADYYKLINERDGGIPMELPVARHLLDGRRHSPAAHRQEGRRVRQAQGQENRAGLS